jgi:hypothetical protein
VSQLPLREVGPEVAPKCATVTGSVLRPLSRTFLHPLQVFRVGGFLSGFVSLLGEPPVPTSPETLLA